MSARDPAPAPQPGPVEEATAPDLPQIRALLESSGLPADGLQDHWPHFLLARVGDRIVGCAGLELPPPGRSALLRSVAVQVRHRSQGLGGRLVEAALGHARRQGVRRVFLLTESAQGFFERHGFRVVSRATAPPGIADGPAFTTTCPATATCMTRSLPIPEGVPGEGPDEENHHAPPGVT